MVKFCWLWYAGFFIDFIMKYIHVPVVPVLVFVFFMSNCSFKLSFLVTAEGS